MKATYKLYIEDTKKIIYHYFPNGINDKSNEFIYSPLSNNGDFDDYNGHIIFCTKTNTIDLIPYSNKSCYSVDITNNTLVYTGPYKSIFTHYSVGMEAGCEEYPELLDKIVLLDGTFESTKFQTGIFTNEEEYRKASVLAILKNRVSEEGKFQDIPEMRDWFDSSDLYLLDDEVLYSFVIEEDDFFKEYDFSKIDYLSINTRNNNLLICVPAQKEYFFCKGYNDNGDVFDKGTSIKELKEEKLSDTCFSEFYNAIINWHSRCIAINYKENTSFNINELKKWKNQ